MIKAYIKSSKGNLLVKDEVTTLSVVLKDGTTTLPLIGYDIVWYKVDENGNYTGGLYTTAQARAVDEVFSDKHTVTVYCFMRVIRRKIIIR